MPWFTKFLFYKPIVKVFLKCHSQPDLDVVMSISAGDGTEYCIRSSFLTLIAKKFPLFTNFGLLKIHKPNVPIRPILSMNGTATQEVAF